MVILEHLTVTDSTIYAIGLVKSFASYTLHITTLSAETGELLTTRNIPSSIENGSDDFFTLSPFAPEGPRLVWIEKGVVKSVALTPKLTNKPQSLKGSINARIVDVGLSEHGLFVARKEDGSASVFKLTQNTIESIWDFADSVSRHVDVPPPFAEKTLLQANSNKNSDSTYTGGVDKDGNPYVGRMYWSFTLQVRDLCSWMEFVCRQLFHVGRGSARLHASPPWGEGISCWIHLSIRYQHTWNDQSRNVF